MMQKEIIMACIHSMGSGYLNAFCIIGGINGKKEIRKFEITPFEGVIRLEPGVFFEIEIETSPGKRIFRYRETDEYKNFFEKISNDDHFSEFAGSSFFPDTGRPGEPENLAYKKDH